MCDELQRLINLYEGYPNDIMCKTTAEYLRKLKPTEVKVQIADSYLDYKNNFLTPEKFAQSIRVSKEQALTIIGLGRVFHEQRAEKAQQEKTQWLN